MLKYLIFLTNIQDQLVNFNRKKVFWEYNRMLELENKITEIKNFYNELISLVDRV